MGGEYDDLLNKLTEEVTTGNLKIELSNGEILTSNTAKFYKGKVYSANGATGLVDLRSDRRTLNGTLSSVKTLIELFSTINIKSITFCGTKFDTSGLDSKNILCSAFCRLARESGRSDLNF